MCFTKRAAKKIFADRDVGGDTIRRPELNKLIEQLRKGDIVVFTVLDRLARNLRFLLDILETIKHHKAGIKSLSEPNIDTTTPVGEFALQLFGVIAEFERQRIGQRVQAGVRHAKKSGKTLGYPRALPKEKADTILRLRRQGTTSAQLSRTFGVSLPTIRKYLSQIASVERVKSKLQSNRTSPFWTAGLSIETRPHGRQSLYCRRRDTLVFSRRSTLFNWTCEAQHPECVRDRARTTWIDEKKMPATDMISTLSVFIFTVLTSVLAAVASAWLTTVFTFRRFRAERGWERRVVAYERIIQSLHQSKAACNEFLTLESAGKEPSEERQKQLSLEFAAATREIERTIDLGTFLLGPKALERLERFQQEFRTASNTGSSVENLLNEWDEMNSCLKDFVNIARTDLKITGGLIRQLFGASEQRPQRSRLPSLGPVRKAARTHGVL